MEPISLILLGVIGTTAAVARKLLTPPRSASSHAFSRAARLLGGRYEFDAWPRPRLAVTIDSVELLTELLGGDATEGKSPATEIRAEVVGAPRLVLLPRGIATAVGSALGGQDVATGDADFDAVFMIKAADEGLARAWLTTRVRRALQGAPAYTYALGEHHATASLPSWETESDRLCAALAATAALSRAGVELYEGWRELAAGMGAPLPAGGAWPSAGLGFDVVVEGVRLRVECSRRPPERERWQTRVLAAASGRELPPALRAEVATLGAVATSDGERVVLEWAGVEPDRERVARALALVAEWVGGGAAAYR